ncbi:MAG: CPBP family intramembrane metalloprotease [Candidatus Marinimicrobia bacterium]|nr:CPBP family intramembrane metalloprotease [Candidatus Neomarinimicrobiota bacterium]
MNHDPMNENKLGISPDQLWNAAGIVQQLITAALMLSAYAVVSLMVRRSPGVYPGPAAWLETLRALFDLKDLGPGILWGIPAGMLIAGILFLLDAGVGMIATYPLRHWVRRTDYMLPLTKKQKKWALGIAVSGSAVEEALFRGFFFMALLPLWSSWIWSALLLSALFSLLHAAVQGFWSTLWIFLVSLIMCLFVARGTGLYFVMAAHMAVNLTNLFVLPQLLDRMRFTR